MNIVANNKHKEKIPAAHAHLGNILHQSGYGTGTHTVIHHRWYDLLPAGRNFPQPTYQCNNARVSSITSASCHDKREWVATRILV